MHNTVENYFVVQANLRIPTAIGTRGFSVGLYLLN